MQRYLIIIEKAEGNFSAYSPDLPGCIATGLTREETIKNMQDAIQLHIRGLIEDHLPVPDAQTSAEYVTAA